MSRGQSADHYANPVIPADAGRPPVEAGQSWAYRASVKDPLVEVRVVRIGVRKPPRVLVLFADDVFEGKQEWVSPARLKALWQDREEFTAREQRWEAVAD